MMSDSRTFLASLRRLVPNGTNPEREPSEPGLEVVQRQDLQEETREDLRPKVGRQMGPGCNWLLTR
jgi:hypothetical protein